MLKAILIDLLSPHINAVEAQYRLEEAENLIHTYGGVVLVKKIQKKVLPNYKTFIGMGKIEEIKENAASLGANILIVNNELKPMQIYNLGELLRGNKVEVWDRIDLILKIFQKRAMTREAKLEIELAAIRHMGPRIYGMGMQLTRQGGGIGTRGAGETNIESMKRHLAKLEDRIKEDLEGCKKIRKLHRDSRRRKNLKTVGIIGYTNAGKSSLLNALTRKGAYAANELFATLDTRVGKMYFQDTGKEILVSDTIGFIQDLPTQLIKSFQSTLEETIEADLLLHVIDLRDPKLEDKIKVVHEILWQIHALDKPTLYVFNKIDLVDKNDRDEVSAKGLKVIAADPVREPGVEPQFCFVSSTTGEGIIELKQKLAMALT